MEAWFLREWQRNSPWQLLLRPLSWLFQLVVSIRRLAFRRGLLASTRLGVPVLVGLFVWRPSPMLILIALMAAPQLWKAWKYRSDSEEAQTYYAVSGATRLEYATYYIVLLAFLAVMTHDVHDMVQAARVAKGF